MAPSRRILLLDAYDSFTNNLAALIRNVTHAEVHTIKIDTYNFEEFRPFLKSFDAVVIGPGPGSPTNAQDVGIIPDIWSLPDDEVVPVFGVCLGFQSLCLAFGGRISRLKVVKHGQSSIVAHTGKDLFEGCDVVDAIRYHSLRAELDQKQLEDLEILATADDGPEENGEVIMAVRHRSKPFWAVQYHPESCCTNSGGAQVVENWWKLATRWLEDKDVVSRPLDSPEWKVPLRQQSLLGETAVTERQWNSVFYNTFRAPCLTIPRLCELLDINGKKEFVMLDSSAKHTGRYTMIGVITEGLTETMTYRVEDQSVNVRVHGTDSVSTVDIDNMEGDVWEMLSKYMNSRFATGGDSESPFWGGFIGYFNYEIGVVGLDIPLHHPRPNEKYGNGKRPDVNLTFFHRSIIVDNISGKVWVQTIKPNDEDWVNSMSDSIQLASAMSITPVPTPPNELSGQHAGQNQQQNATNGLAKQALVGNATPFPLSTVTIQRPDKDKYIENVKRCQGQLALGESYELCLTGQTTIDIQHPHAANPQQDENTAWKIYQYLRKKNPAPFAGYYKIAGTTLLSSSPERFLSWDRNGQFQLRPIKGTVRKAKPDGTQVTRREAEAILNTPKERAENLMIVDLIRHDLHGVLDGQDDEDGGVKVSKLMSIEEYETVFQLVSVIEGNMGKNMKTNEGFTGMDVLSRSLPPGSMTGAPKKRSVEILKEIEREADEGANCGERAVYSGVLGYWSVCGAGDWSVIIRSMFRFDDEFEQENVERREDGQPIKERWRIGAGGAITALSDPEGEWEEMLTKLDSALAVFQ